MSNAVRPPTPDYFPSFWGLLGRWPFGDDWKNVVGESGLPIEVQNMIQQVVSNSRLMRFEKIDVANDLIAHFQDGSQRGASFPRLLEEFGDPLVTAELIHRSKTRNRPMIIKTIKALGIGAGALFAVYVITLVFFHLGHPNPSVNYLTEFNGPIYDYDESQKAWPVYRPVWTKYQFCEGGECKFEEIYTNDEDGNPGKLIAPDDKGWPQAVAMLAEYKELLDNFRQGAKLPSLGLELQADPRNYSDEDYAALFPGRDRATDQPNSSDDAIMKDALILVLLPHVQSFRKAARVLTVDTRLAVEEQDSDRAVENIETILGLAKQAAETPCLVCTLVGYAVHSIGLNTLEEVMTADPDFFSQQDLARLQAKIESLQLNDWLDYDGELASIKDIIQRCYTDDGYGDGRMTPDGIELLSGPTLRFDPNQGLDKEYETLARVTRTMVGPASLFLCASRKATTEKADQFIDLCNADKDLPFWVSHQTNRIKFEEMELELTEKKFKWALLSMLLPATQSIRMAMDRSIGRQEGVVAALAIHQYYKKYGEWPDKIDQLSPEFVAEFPVDQFDGSLVKFKYDDESLTVYSVGRNLTDDGGIGHSNGADVLSPAQIQFGPPSDQWQGDWILWPQN